MTWHAGSWKPSNTSMAKIRVLIVDDHAVVRQGLQSLLLDDATVAVVGEAADGAAALRQVEALQPDVVLLDIRMPGMDGLEVTRRLRLAHPETRIIILTTYAEDEYLVAALRAGAQGYLLKSILYEDLVRAINNVYHGSRSLAPDLVGRVMELAGNLARGEAPVSESPPLRSPGGRPDAATRFDLHFGPGSWQRLVDGYNRGHSATQLAAQFDVTAQTIRNWLVKGGLAERMAGRGRPPSRVAGTSELSQRELEILNLIAAGRSNKEAAAMLGISVNTVRVHVHDIFRKLGITSRTQAALHVLKLEQKQ
jgi:DNA-binding NarL/FixJ family response regulator